MINKFRNDRKHVLYQKSVWNSTIISDYNGITFPAVFGFFVYKLLVFIRLLTLWYGPIDSVSVRIGKDKIMGTIVSEFSITHQLLIVYQLKKLIFDMIGFSDINIHLRSLPFKKSSPALQEQGKNIYELNYLYPAPSASGNIYELNYLYPAPSASGRYLQ